MKAIEIVSAREREREGEREREKGTMFAFVYHWNC